MASIAYDEFERRVSSDTKKITELCNICLQISTSYIILMIMMTALSYRAIRMALRVRNIEKRCGVCERQECTMQDDLKTASDTLNKCADQYVKLKFPPIFLSLIRHAADVIDNKAENLSIASDREFKSLVSQLADKMNQ